MREQRGVRFTACGAVVTHLHSLREELHLRTDKAAMVPYGPTEGGHRCQERREGQQQGEGEGWSETMPPCTTSTYSQSSSAAFLSTVCETVSLTIDHRPVLLSLCRSLPSRSLQLEGGNG